ncbi:copper homeostasis protein CutC [Pseudogemmobacter sonorensis]|uniref:copper homeostasis protein CutC n=1 Tax=Pseudogemmobacter sonorensis TaxID=2989681 RepID=UPI0036BA7A37
MKGPRILLEVCVEDAAGILAADNGADRIELCAALALGGLTPSAGLMDLAVASPLPTMAMIRPRAGDFVWSAAERRAMRAEIRAARAAGLAGVVIGASLPDGRLDDETLAELLAEAAGLDVTLHRAIDLCPDPAEAMETCARLGIRRVLSSGGAATAAAGVARLKAMARPGITVMPGAGIDAGNLRDLARLALREVHASCSSPRSAPGLAAVETFGFQPKGARATDPARVAALRAALDQISASQPEGWTAS